MFSESEAYEQFMGRWSRQLAAPFVVFAGTNAGDVVLDVGSGTGALASAVLAETDSSRVIGIDPSTAYVEYARTRTKNERARVSGRTSHAALSTRGTGSALAAAQPGRRDGGAARHAARFLVV
jgi:2-polyprenyl-3-methyl-5-hydroxy-6-metoxy-1,4-benzoquinol methylase